MLQRQLMHQRLSQPEQRHFDRIEKQLATRLVLHHCAGHQGHHHHAAVGDQTQAQQLGRGQMQQGPSSGNLAGFVLRPWLARAAQQGF